MLVQFSVGNFLSFKDETTFSMVADGGDQQHPDHVLPGGSGKSVALLRAAAIYGANGSGKSNLVKALQFARNRVVRGSRPDQTIPVVPFRLGRADQKRLSTFEFLIKHDGVLYSYGFRLNSSRVAEEWLFATPKLQEVRFFARKTDEKGQTTVEFGTQFSGKGAKQKQFLEFVAQGTRPNQLFLTEAADRNIKVAKPVSEWFRDVLVIIPAESRHQGLEFRAHRNASFTEYLTGFLRHAGTGIDGISTKEVALDFDRDLPDMPEEMREKVKEDIATLNQDKFYVVDYPNGARMILTRADDGQPKRLLLRTRHKAEDGREVHFPIEDESEGTQRLVHLVPTLVSMNEEPEKVVVLDELDRRLHPLLCRRFLEAALQSGGPQNKSQLIFTTHDTNLLDLELLRRDEIWFVEKDAGGASKMYSLAEFKIRPDLKIQKGYLNGRFGAIPFFGDISRLGWTEEAPKETEEAAAA